MKRVYKDERGSSLVMTVIAMTFISILAVAVIAMTITNIRLKQAQKESQKNFYNADSIVDAIRAGLYDIAAESAESAYEDAIITYGSSSTTMKQVYTKEFMKNMVDILSNGASTYSPSGGSTYYYSDTVIRRFLTDAQSGNGAVLADGYQSAVSDNPGYGYLEVDLDSLILKDVKVMKTDKDYQTMIKTDIRVNVPNITEETDSEYLAYALIADNQILSENSTSNIVNGSVYAGISKSNIINASRPESGLIVSSGSNLLLNSDFVITRGDIRMDGNGTLTINTGADKDSGVYAENIETKQEKVKATNTLSISGNTYIADDMELWGDGDVVTLAGNYYGYNYNNDYSSPTVGASKQSEFSSAILINGRNTSLNMEGVRNMMLAGYTFISRGLNTYEDTSKNERFDGTKFAKDNAGGNYQNQDIGMGESMTIKASQLAYYVPSDYVKDGASTDAGKITFTVKNETEDVYNFNAEGYTNYLNCSDASFNITDYVDATTPLTCYYRNDVNVKGDLKYFYLNFKSDKEAKKFYEVYKKCTPYKDVEDVNKEMLSNTGIRLNVNGDGTEKDGAVLTRTGNLLYGNKGTTGGKANQYILKPNQDIGDVYLYNDAKDISKSYMSYQMSLMKNYDLALSSSQFRLDLRSPAQVIATVPAGDQEITRKSTFTKCGDAFEDNTSPTDPTPNDPDVVFKTNLFSTLVDERALDAYTGPQYQEMEVKMKDGSTRKAFVVIATDDYTWDGSDATDPTVDSGLILARGNVTLSAPFKGLVIAGEDIAFSGGNAGSVSADRKLLQQMFNADKELGSASKFYYMFSKYFQTTISSSISNGDKSKDTVEYENWKKNKEEN